MNTAVPHAEPVRLALHGDLDASSTAQVRRELFRAIRTHPAGRITVDVSGVTSLHEPVVGVLVESYRQASSTGGSLRLILAMADVTRLLGDAGLAGALLGPH